MQTGPIPTIVTADITLNLVMGAEYGVPVRAEFRYIADHPYSITAHFHTGSESVEWVFARDLLLDGLHHPTGDGDITCWPATVRGERVLCLSLVSPTGQALLEAPAETVDGFLQRCVQVVPLGAEGDFLDIDGLITDLLREDGTH